MIIYIKDSTILIRLSNNLYFYSLKFYIELVLYFIYFRKVILNKFILI